MYSTPISRTNVPSGYLQNSPVTGGSYVTIQLNDMSFSDTSSEEEEEEISLKMKDLSRDWNNEYQRLLIQPESKEKYDNLGELMKSFVSTAELYGKLIISERCLASEKKTIDACNLGGVAGGDKFIVHGILYKFACDPKLGSKYLYGGSNPSQELASKAAKHELNNVIAFNEAKEITKEKMENNMVELCTPLMALIDYKGYRMVATPVLPLAELIYGTADGGRTVHCDNQNVNETFSCILKHGLHLKEHLVSGVSLCGPADLEGHTGKDGRYYVLDYARLLPPEAPDSYQMNSIFYFMIRKELLRSSYCKNISLNSDSFSNFSRKDPNFNNDNSVIRDITQVIYSKIIPEFIESLLSEDFKQIEKNHNVQQWICNSLHSFGLNIRHLGRIRNYLSTLLESNSDKNTITNGNYWNNILLIEVFARSISQMLRMTMRVVQENALSSGNMSLNLCYLFNDIISSNQDILNKLIQIVEEKYITVFSDKEKSLFEKGLCWYIIDLNALFIRVSSLSCIHFSSRICNLLENGAKNLLQLPHIPLHLLDRPESICSFLPSDIIAIEAKIWRSDLMERANGIQTLYEIQSKLQIPSHEKYVEYLPIISHPNLQQLIPLINDALGYFETGLIASPTSPFLQYLASLTCLHGIWIHLIHSLYSCPSVKDLQPMATRIQHATEMAAKGRRFTTYCMTLLCEGELYHRVGLLDGVFSFVIDGLNCPKNQNSLNWSRGEYDENILQRIYEHAEFCFPLISNKEFLMEDLFPCLLQQAEILLLVASIFGCYASILTSSILFKVCIRILQNKLSTNGNSKLQVQLERAIFGLLKIQLLTFTKYTDVCKQKRIIKHHGDFDTLTSSTTGNNDEEILCNNISIYAKNINHPQIVEKLENLIQESFNGNEFSVKLEYLIRAALIDSSTKFGKSILQRIQSMNFFKKTFHASESASIALKYIAEQQCITTLSLSSGNPFSLESLLYFLKHSPIISLEVKTEICRKPEEQELFVPVFSKILQNIEYLDIDFSEDIWVQLLDFNSENWMNLKSLTITKRLSEEIFDKIIKRCISLEHLDLRGSQNLNGNTLFKILQEQLESGSNLKSLILSGTRIHSELKDYNVFENDNLWKSFSKLESLCIEQCDFTKDEYTSLFSSLNCKLSKLIIKMPGRDIDDSVFENSNLSLKYIEFLQTNSVTENGWLTLIKRTPSLETISLIGHFRSVTDTVIDAIFQYCNNIYDLNISGCSSITGDCFNNIESTLNCINTLQRLDISNLKFNPGTFKLIGKFKNIVCLKLLQRPVNAEELIHVISSLDKLHELHLYNDCDKSIVEQLLKRGSFKELNYVNTNLPTKFIEYFKHKNIVCLNCATVTSTVKFLLQ